MATFALIHGGGEWAGTGTRWRTLRSDGHQVVAPDLPCEDDSATLWDYAGLVIDAIGDRGDLMVVGQSCGGFTVPLVLR